MANALFRCDGGPDIGLGHVMRCRALAAAFIARGWNCWFAMTAETAALDGEPEPIIVPSGLEGASAVATAIATRNIECLVVDHYRLDASFETAARGPAKIVVAIDDLANRRHECDMIVDSNPGRTAADYAGLAAADTRLLLGAHYVLLGRQFAARRPTQAKPAPMRPQRLLITLGGADPENFSACVLAALRHTGNIAEQVLLVIGPANPHRDRLIIEAAEIGVECVIDPTDLADWMSESDMAVTAGGVTCSELICLGVPVVVLLTADNQRAIGRAVDEAGAGIVLDGAQGKNPRNIAAAMAKLATDQALRRRMASRGRALVDGRGAERVAAAVIELIGARQQETRP